MSCIVLPEREGARTSVQETSARLGTAGFAWHRRLRWRGRQLFLIAPEPLYEIKKVWPFPLLRRGLASRQDGLIRDGWRTWFARHQDASLVQIATAPQRHRVDATARPAEVSVCRSIRNTECGRSLEINGVKAA